MMSGWQRRMRRLSKPVRFSAHRLLAPILTTYVGLNYERKAKKNARDATEEHTRYIALLGSVGPELTQEK
jgi:hypothetical protein